jgi:hypothetical protein
MTPIPNRVVPSIRPDPRPPRAIAREFRALLEGGAKLLPAGSARRAPRRLLSRGYGPAYKLALFDTRYYLSRVRRNPDLHFYVAYVVLPRAKGRALEIHPRIFYKDVSLVWRSASHYVRSDDENWIGKGDVRTYRQDGEEVVASAEETTDLPLEVQTALELLLRRAKPIRTGTEALELVLHRGPDDRVEPYRDFTASRRRAQADRRNLIHGGRSIARFRRRNDPGSLVIARGFEPDFAGGVLERSSTTSKLYGGRVRRFRVLSRNRKIQWLFFASPRHAWIMPPQATTTELSSYGVRTIDVIADEDLFVPGFEYHYWDDGEDPPQLVSQIPPGFVGPASPLDASRSDASAWLERLPVIRAFRCALAGPPPKAARRRAARAAGRGAGLRRG